MLNIIIQLLVLDIKLFDAFSLKDKRRIIKSILETSKNKFNISAIESNYQDLHQRAEISLAFLASSKSQSDSIADNILNYIEGHLEGEVTNITRDYL